MRIKIPIGKIPGQWRDGQAYAASSLDRTVGRLTAVAITESRKPGKR
jgi:hypothetical protein